MNLCLDEGTLQAYLDGELAPVALNDAAAHLASCVACAKAAHEAEAELSLLATAYADALPAHVPTEKMRARLDDAIAEMQPSPARLSPLSATSTTPAASTVRAFFASIASFLTTLTPRQATAFAGLLVAVALAVVFFAARRAPDNSRDVAIVKQSTSVREPASVKQTTTPAATSSGTPSNSSTTTDAPTSAPHETTAGVARASVKATDGRSIYLAAKYERPDRRVTNTGRDRAKSSEAKLVSVAAKNEVVLADEKAYLSSIASLTSVVEAQGSLALPPTLRAEYERNRALVNQAISASRAAALRSPADADAKEFLRAAYRNKVELLSAVAEQTQIASARD